MRIGADDVPVDEGRPVPFATVAHGPLERGIARYRIGAVDFLEVKVGEPGNQARNASASGLHFDGHRDWIAVMFNAKNNRKLSRGGGLHRFPEFPFAGSPTAEGNVSHSVTLEADVL